MKISKTNLILYLYIIATIPPSVIAQNNIIKLLLNLIQIIGFFYIILGTLRKKNVPYILLLMVFFDFVLLFSTIIGNKNIYRCFIEIFNNLAFPFLFLSKLVDRKKLLKILRNYFNAINIINFLFLLIGVFLRGKSADDSLFIADSNSITLYIILTFVFEGLYLYYFENLSRKKIEIFFLIVMLSITEIMIWSATGMIAWFSCLLIFFWSQFGKSREIPYFPAITVPFVLSIILFCMGVSPLFRQFLDFLGKDITLTGRTNIWASAIHKITYSVFTFLFGYGYGERSLYNYYAHNEILELMINGGVLLLICMVAIYIYLGLLEARSSNKNSYGNTVIKVALIGIGIDMMTEVETVSLLFLLFCIFYLCINGVFYSNEGELNVKKYIKKI